MIRIRLRSLSTPAQQLGVRVAKENKRSQGQEEAEFSPTEKGQWEISFSSELNWATVPPRAHTGQMAGTHRTPLVV